MGYNMATQNTTEYKNDTVLGSLQALKNTANRLEQAVRTLIDETEEIRRGNRFYFEDGPEVEDDGTDKDPLSGVTREMQLIDYSIERSLQSVLSLIVDINLK